MKDSMQDLIDRYVRGEMSVEEKASFEKHILEDDELRKQLEYTMKVSEAIKDRSEKLEKIRRWNSEENNTKKSVKFYNTFTGKIVYGLLSIAAIVAVVLYFNRCPSMPELDVQHYECYRGCADVTKIVQLIENEKYSDALNLIENTEKEYMTEKDSISKLIPTASLESLNRMEYELTANKADSDEIQWLKVYAYIGLKRYKDARELLRNISETIGIYTEKADSLLHKLS